MCMFCLFAVCDVDKIRLYLSQTYIWHGMCMCSMLYIMCGIYVLCIYSMFYLGVVCFICTLCVVYIHHGMQTTVYTVFYSMCCAWNACISVVYVQLSSCCICFISTWAVNMQYVLYFCCLCVLLWIFFLTFHPASVPFLLPFDLTPELPSLTHTR